MRGCTPARNMGFMSVWQMTNAEPPRWTYGHRLKAEPTKSLTTLLGLGQESLVNGSRDFFLRSHICFLLFTLWLLYALYHCPRGILSRIYRAYINNPPHLSFSHRLARVGTFANFSLINRVIYFRANFMQKFVFCKMPLPKDILSRYWKILSSQQFYISKNFISPKIYIRLKFIFIYLFILKILSFKNIFDNFNIRDTCKYLLLR